MARLSFLAALAGTAFGVVALAPTDADACGGTFCDGGAPAPMPVDQSGENILFVRDGNMMEAHIQIQYEGDPEKFGWVVPLTAEPTEMKPGSEPLFQNMLAGSVPLYGFSRQNDSCQAPSPNGGDAQGGGTGAAGDDGGGEDGGDDGGVNVLAMENVGAFEVSVIQGTDAMAIVEWLDENDYQQDPDSIPILEEYIAEGHVFAAVKLTVGSGVDEIHPIMFRFESNEACVPLRLTRIAAVEDMEIRTFFLGGARTVPRTYRHVEVNPLKIDWPSQATNYKEVVTLAVDEEHADGRAFVTEYAGASDVIGRNGIVNASWNSGAFEDVAPTEVVNTLSSQGLWECGEDQMTFEFICRPTHPLVQPLLDEFLPVPEGIEPSEFYENLINYEGQIDLEVWDAAAFAAGLEDRVFGPGRHAEELLENNRYLTRMYTTISPSEMTEDPMFHENNSLEEVPALRQATQRILCNNDSIWTLPDGREVYVPAGDPWPDFDVEAPMDEKMPVAEYISEVPAEGAPMRLADNAEMIDIQLRAYNEGKGWNGAEVGPGEEPKPELSGGCGCTTGSPAGAVWALGFGIFLFGARRRRS
ncbi:MAG: DUF2330 domain-containing protein [Myxococcota bacterium]